MLAAAAAGIILVCGGCAFSNTAKQQGTSKMKKNYTPPFKKSNVNYSKNKVCKTVSVPLVTDDFKFGTAMTDPVWQKAAKANDFVPYRRKKLQKGSEFSVFRTADSLVIGFFFEENKKNIVFPKNLNESIWSGDMAEIHFGGMEPDPWLTQLGISVNGTRFDSTGNFNSWKAKTFIKENGWGAEIMLNQNMLRLTEGGFRFNLCRQSLKRKEFSTWSPLIIRFHEVENFGEFIYGDYSTVFNMRYGLTTDNLTRDEYEKLSAKYQIPAMKVIHGPYVSNISNDSATISWGTAGKVPAFVQYREKGSKDAPKRVYSNKQHGILKHDTAHFVKLENLKRGVEYEYELFALSPVALKEKSSKIVRSFRMPEANLKEFSFIVSSDIHSDVGFLNKIISTEAADNASFHALLGDLLSHAAGRDALYDGIIAPLVANENKKAVERPFVFVRGNHEELGVYAAEYFTVMKHPTEKSYYTFNYGDVCFIVLDSGNDTIDSTPYFSNTELYAEEKTFLQEVVKSDAYKKAKRRIVFVHIPPLGTSPRMKELSKLLQTLAKAEVKPDAMLCGHMHNYMRIDANSSSYNPATRSNYALRFPIVEKWPFPIIVNSNNTFVECKVKNDKLTFYVFAADKNGDLKEKIDTIIVD